MRTELWSDVTENLTDWKFSFKIWRISFGAVGAFAVGVMVVNLCGSLKLIPKDKYFSI